MSDCLDAERPTRIRWLIFALACGTSWFLYLHRYTWNIIAPELQRTYSFDNTELGVLFSLFNASYAIGQIPSGVLSDFVGPHLFLGTIIVLWSLSMTSFGLTGDRYALGALRVVFGSAQAGCYPALTKVTHAWFPLRSRTTVQGWVATFFGRSGGAMSSIIMGTLLMGALGLSWPSALAIMGMSGVAFGVLFLILFRNSPDQHPQVNRAEQELIREGQVQSSNEPRVLPVRRAIGSRSLRFLIAQQFLDAGSDSVFVAFIGLYFLKTRGLEISTAGLLVSLPLWGGALGGIAGGWLNDFLIRRSGNRRWSRTSVGLCGKVAGAVMVFVMIRQASPEAAAFALFWAKFVSDTSQPTVWGTCTDLAGRYSATVFSIANTAGSVGAMVMPVVFGWILDANTRTVPGAETAKTNWTPLFLLIAAMYVVSGLCWLLIDCTRSLERDAELRERPL